MAKHPLGKPLTVRDLYPCLVEEDQIAAEENLRRYVVLVLRIYERMQAESTAYAHEPLTDDDDKS